MYRIRWLVIPALMALLPTLLHSQSYPKQGGNFSIGVRNTFSTFSDGDPHAFGYGFGGNFRIQVLDRVNTDWYADILTSNLYNLAHRTDYHIGWSVMYYILNPKAFHRPLTPFVLAGHCFDYTGIRLNGENQPTRSRLSSAVQAGLGCSYNVTPRMDISLAVQYMLHLGKEIDAEKLPEGDLEIVEHKNAGWEGHLLISLSVNYKIAKLWKAKR